MKTVELEKRECRRRWVAWRDKLRAEQKLVKYFACGSHVRYDSLCRIKTYREQMRLVAAARMQGAAL